MRLLLRLVGRRLDSDLLPWLRWYREESERAHAQDEQRRQRRQLSPFAELFPPEEGRR